MKHKITSTILSFVLLFTIFAYTTPVLAFTKDDTVYSKLDSTGSSYNTIVSTHIKNEEQEKLIHDLSDLLNIKNVKGDEEFKQDGTSLVWDAEGNDIYYQGESQKELPIDCRVTYELNGEEILPKDLAGKSGKVKITIEYTNKDKHVVTINGVKEELYTPFVVVCGTIINNDSHRNIAITNGKVIDDGSKTILIGMSLPGLQESLGISKDQIEIPSTIEITMESTNFELNNIISYITPKLIEESDLDLFDGIDEIYSKVNTLKNSSKQLEEGANTLKQGTNTYYQKSQEFNRAMKQVSSGINSANENYSKIDNGIRLLNKNSETLQSGAKSVSDGTQAVSTNLKTISEKLAELQIGTKNLQSGEKQISDGLDKILSSVNGIGLTDYSAKIAEVNELIKANESAIKNLKTVNTNLNSQITSELDEQTAKIIYTQIETNKSLITLLESNVKANKEIITSLKQTDLASIKDLQTALNSLKQGMLNIQAGTESIYNGQVALKTGTDTLASKTEELSQGATSLYQGTVKISEGTNTLNTGSVEMKNGLNTLDSGANELLNANNQLTEGSNTLSEGATTLSNGICKFNEEGIDKICNAITGNFKDLTARMEKLQVLSQEYNNFSMLNDGYEGNVKFIMIMDSIKEEQNGKQEIIIDEKNDE